jgi:hypothetical protein
VALGVGGLVLGLGEEWGRGLGQGDGGVVPAAAAVDVAVVRLLAQGEACALHIQLLIELQTEDLREIAGQQLGADAGIAQRGGSEQGPDHKHHGQVDNGVTVEHIEHSLSMVGQQLQELDQQLLEPSVHIELPEHLGDLLDWEPVEY